jgi:hypothetical protein
MQNKTLFKILRAYSGNGRYNAIETTYQKRKIISFTSVTPFSIEEQIFSQYKKIYGSVIGPQKTHLGIEQE